VNGNVIVTDDAIPPVQNGYWLVVLASVRTPPVRNRLAVGAYIGYNGKWVSQPNTIINITINNSGSASITIRREDGSVIGTATTSPFTVLNTSIVNSLGTEIAVAKAQGDAVLIVNQTAEGTTGLGGITFPTDTTGIIPDVDYTDSDGSPQNAPYGSPITCTPIVCPTLDELVNTSSSPDVITAVQLANKECPVLEGLALEYGGIGNFSTWGATTTPYCVGIENNEFYVVLNGGSVQVFDAATRTLQRTILGFGTACRHIRFNATQYLVTAYTTGRVRIMDTATDTQDALITTVAVFSAGFNPNNGNVFWTNGGTIEEKTQANAVVGATFTSANVVRQRTIKNEPSTNRMWVGGDSGNAVFGRLSYFDATTRAFTNITFSGTITFAINVITGLAFDGTYIYVIHQTGGSTAMCMTKIDDTGVVQNQTLILGDDAGICGDYYAGYGCPVVLYPISILSTNGIAKVL
jgi:hypothetical protein